jgi:hypothetical protein
VLRGRPGSHLVRVGGCISTKMGVWVLAVICLIAYREIQGAALGSRGMKTFLKELSFRARIICLMGEGFPEGSFFGD